MQNEAGRGGAGSALLFAHQGAQILAQTPCRCCCVAREFAVLSGSRKNALGDLDLKYIQMRVKRPRLFKDDGGNVDS